MSDREGGKAIVMEKRMNEIITAIRLIHKDSICLFKVGTFFHCYNRDTYILSYLFGYKIRDIEKDGKECGFPVGAVNKVISQLEHKKINYVIIDKRNNYNEEEFCNFNDLNNYKKYFEKAKGYINYRKRIENINQFLLEHLEEENFKDLLGRIENEIYKGRKI